MARSDDRSCANKSDSQLSSTVSIHRRQIMKSFDRNLLSPFKNRLTVADLRTTLRTTFLVMSKVCSITGAKVTRGSVIHRRGMAKKKGGVGRHVTKNVPRTFTPNLHEHRVWVPELRKFMRVKMSARGLKTLNKNGAFQTLKKAGLISA